MRSLPAALLILLLLAAPAGAKMEIAMQDDNTIVHGYASRDLALRQFKAMGGTSVRISLFHSRDKDRHGSTSVNAVSPALDLYDSGIADVVEQGLKPQITLVWRNQRNPKKIAAWAASAAEHFGDQVNRYSILNEPDLLLPVPGACGKQGQRRFVNQFPAQMLHLRNGKIRARVLTQQRAMNLQTACLRFARGKAYRPVVQLASRAIHGANPKAQVLAGETSAQPGLEWFVRGAQPKRLDVAGWAHHPFQLHDLTPQREPNSWGIGNFGRLKRLIKLPIYLTEFGFPHPHSSMDKRVMGRRLKWSEVSASLTRAWTIAHDKGAREMLQFQWFIKPPWRKEYWETALLNHDDGRTTPAYRALRRLVLSWK